MMKNTPDIQKKSNQIVGNAGLFYCCYRLSLMGWNVLPTSRNVKGIDIVAYKNEIPTKFVTIQVKSLSKKNPVGIGGPTDTLMGDFWVIINNLNLQKNPPNAYILTLDEIKKSTKEKQNDAGKLSFWLQPKDYCIEKYLEQWDRIRI